MEPETQKTDGLFERLGLARIWRAFFFSLSGLQAAFRKEAAFRQDVYLCAVLGLLAVLMDVSSVERALLLGSLAVLLITELLNSALEWTVNLATSEIHPFAKYAKDMGSAAVFCALVNVAVVWMCVIL